MYSFIPETLFKQTPPSGLMAQLHKTPKAPSSPGTKLLNRWFRFVRLTSVVGNPTRAVPLEMTCVVSATLIMFFNAATLSGEFVGGMWSSHTQCWRVHDQLGITKLHSKRRISCKQNPCSYRGVCRRRCRMYQR